ncbi:hypothetical protein QTO34_017794 [Cnephaeus nilssonii]|uniref:Uncharacterized protein n=1 Tax=Cnephaeus nilssonii TaxID=3371016 RepID=A0AA40I1N8_CNENI|nr:hypothetical protein QTO34_017794 [Eptesicus nilssonii]
MAKLPETSRDSMGSAKMFLLLLSMALLALSSAQDISNGTDTENSPEGPQSQEEETQPSARMSRESRKAHVAKVEEEAEVVKVAREAKMARVAEVAEVTRVALVARVVSVEEVARVVSVVANDKENQLKMASSHSLGSLNLAELAWHVRRPGAENAMACRLVTG